MHERVRGYADAVLDGLGPNDLPEAAGQLRSFTNLLAASDDLRAAFAVPTTSALTRRAIVQDLLGKKASPPVLALLSYEAQVSAGADLPGDVDHLAATAEARVAGMVAIETGPLGRTAAKERLAGYAAAVLASLRDERQLGNTEDELFRFMRIVEGNDELRVALTTNELPAAARHPLAKELLGGRASDATVRLATYAAVIGRPRDYLELLSFLVDLVAAEAKRRVADVRSAVEMTEQQRLRLAAALAKLTGTPVDVRVTVDADLLGGFVATVGDTLVDASLRHRLELARELLAAPSPTSGQGPESN